MMGEPCMSKPPARFYEGELKIEPSRLLKLAIASVVIKRENKWGRVVHSVSLLPAKSSVRHHLDPAVQRWRDNRIIT
jgi:hypothetical protein